ncbi:MAG: DNA-directed RNA polymerase subunit D [Methanomassiliicoccales archaeon]|nr:MAG: DNA-directed RNA polymerase subunit D [Methanomassiliicoccales archaeon]
MELEILELTDTKAKFIVSEISPPAINALRRTLIADVPKMAIDNVEFHLGPIRNEHGKEYESITPLFDEIIAHRLGMVPIPTDLDLFVFRDDCVCKGEGCPNCTIMYSLNKKGPSEDDKKENLTVYSDELQLVVQKVEGVSEKKYAEKFQINKKIPLVRLNKSQALLLYATAELGRGNDHAKWQVAQAVGYQYYPIINIDKKKCDSGGSCVESCPKNVLEQKKKEIIVANLENCNMCGTCEEVCSLGAVKVDGDDSKFIFQFETDGALSAKEAITRALVILEDEFEELRDLAGKLK